jgi:hypothetical protein
MICTKSIYHNVTNNYTHLCRFSLHQLCLYMSTHFWDILMTYLQPLSDEQSIYLQLSFIMSLPRPSTRYLYPLQIVCLAKYVDGESLRNGMFTICQIGFIGTVIQWWSLMQWYNMKWILPYYGHSSAVIYVIYPGLTSNTQGLFPFM